MRRPSSAVLLALLVAGCGQKGPLVLPDRGATAPVVIRPATTAPPAPAPAPAPAAAPAKKTASEDDATQAPR